jgi:hypothetical protein
MRTLAKSVLALLSITLVVALGADKKFEPGSPEQYAHQENQKVVIGTKPFDTSDETKPVFGKKVDLNAHGILPVLVVIQNNRPAALDLNGLEVKLVPAGGQSVIPLEPAEVANIAMPGKVKVPDARPSPNPIPHKQKNPFNSLELIERAFVAHMLPPGEQASGFFYFQARPEPGMHLLVKGIFERPSGKEILYFEIPI